MAGGLALHPDIADQAADWLTLLMSGEATELDRHNWQQWREAHPDHERAWRHIEAVTGRLKVLQPQAAYRALSPYADAIASRSSSSPHSSHSSHSPHSPQSAKRRKALKLLMWGGVVCGTGLLASRTQTWQEASADYASSTGERKTVDLVDGTRITLNTASAIDVRFDASYRRIRLLAGEVMIVTGHAHSDEAADPRPFIIETAEGAIRALGTRFTVRQWHKRTSVAVIESAVEITPTQAADRVLLLRAGESVVFHRQGFASVVPTGEQAVAWLKGQILADNVRLADFMQELSRYRKGQKWRICVFQAYFLSMIPTVFWRPCPGYCRYRCACAHVIGSPSSL